MAERSPESSPNRIDEAVACDTCGRFGAVEVGNRLLCPDCYQGCGSCCAGIAPEEQDASV